MELSTYVSRQIIKQKIKSNFLQQTRQIRIALPPGFNQLISYPILYAQDGEDMFMFGRLATIHNYLVLEKEMEPAIIVGIDVDKQRRTEEYHLKGKYNQAYVDFFVQELLPFIEEEYLLHKQEEGRILIGDSLGAAISLQLALEFPQLFSRVLSLSGAFFGELEELIKQSSNLESLYLWMLIGQQETSVDTAWGEVNFLEWNRKICTLLLEKQATVTLEEDTGEHTWGFWQKKIPEGLLHFLG